MSAPWGREGASNNADKSGQGEGGGLAVSGHPFQYGLCRPGCIPCKAHAGVTQVYPQVYAKVEGWRTPEVQRSKGLYVQICILLRQHAKV